MPINHGAAFTGSGASFRSTASYTNGVYVLNERAIKKMDEDFAKKSYTNAAANLSNFSWAGANAITIESEGRGRINAYDFGAALGSRMGALHEVNTERNTYQLKNVYSARETFEKIYSDDSLNELICISCCCASRICRNNISCRGFGCECMVLRVNSELISFFELIFHRVIQCDRFCLTCSSKCLFRFS